MDINVKIGKPIGTFTIDISNESHTQNNLFTDYGLSQVYKSGKNTVINTTNGGIFKHCRIGNGITPITSSNTSLSSSIALTSTLTSTRLSYYTKDGTRYAQGVFKYTFTGNYEGEITELMLTSLPSNSGMICGQSLTNPLIIASGDVVVVTYVVQIPIISAVDNVLETGVAKSHSGVDVPYTFSGRFHDETPTALYTILPIETPWVITGNLSRMYVNNVIMESGESRFKCTSNITANKVVFTCQAAVMGNVGELNIINANLANTTQGSTGIENFPYRIVFASGYNKPDGLDWVIDFKINIEVG